MKVLFILPNGQMYGDNKAIINIIPYMINMGVTPIFLVHKIGPASSIIEKKGYRYRTISGYYPNVYPNSHSLRAWLNFFKNYILFSCNLIPEISSFISFINEEKPDIIHSNNGMTRLGLKLSQKTGIKHIWHIREYGDLDAGRNRFPCMKTFLTALNSKNNYNITVTEDIRRYFKLHVSNSCSIYDGPIRNDINLPVIKKKEKYILFVGRLDEAKGVDMVLAAFNSFQKKHKSYYLKIAGTGNKQYTQKLILYAKENNISDLVQFLGYRDDVPDLMSRASMLIVASRCEAFGFITAEAMYYGCEVVGFNTAGTAEQMNNIDTYVRKNVCKRFNDIDSLLEKMDEIIEKPLSFECLHRIQKFVSNNYSAERSASEVVKKYIEILK